MRLIDAEQFDVYCIAGKSEEFMYGVDHVLESLDNAPTIDAVPVVRCKDCCAWDDKRTFMSMKACSEWSHSEKHIRWTKPDEFCSRAMKLDEKDGDGE